MVGTGGRPLAGPARAGLASYLDHRQHVWPHTANPHLFITQQTALRNVPASDRWIRLKLGMTVRAIREDRILYEAMAPAVTNADSEICSACPSKALLATPRSSITPASRI